MSVQKPKPANGAKPVVFVQSFSIGHVGGGARILKSVIEDSPVPVVSICTGFCSSLPPNGVCEEFLEPLRPPLGRLDRTRFAHLGGWVEALVSPLFRRRLRARIVRLNPRAIHVVPHSWGDFAVAHSIARELGIPIHASFHDDFAYTAGRHPRKARLLGLLGDLWREATTRFVVCNEIGDEHSRRFGRREYLIHTDGVADVNVGAGYEPPSDEVRFYFMGMMNQPYVPNVRSLANALPLLSARSSLKTSLTLRTHGYSPEPGETTTVLPFAPESVVRGELPSQHFLFLPLPLGDEFEGLWRYGFSTKMISYLASGVPILYQGPAEAATGRYLSQNEAALCIHTTDPQDVASAIADALKTPDRLRQIRDNALKLVSRDFDARKLRDRFWNAILDHTPTTPAS